MIYELKISLLDTKPEIWSQVLIPGHFTFYRLHQVIQIAMGWQDSHLFSFHTGDFVSSDTITLKEYLHDDDVYDRKEAGYKTMYAERKRIQGYFSRCKSIFYTYDYGDFWQHQVVKTGAIDLEMDHAMCTCGKRACPADDCGGISGFYEMLSSIANPKDPEYKEWRHWLGIQPDMDYEDAFGYKEELVNLILQDV